MPLPLLAIPVIHSSGAWIASTAAGGYLAGTLSSTWVGAFVLGNGALLSSVGLASGAAAIGAAATSTMGGFGALLSYVGLGGVASALGIAPAVTFLGLTPVGWAITAGAVGITSLLGYFICKKSLHQINSERNKGGLPSITLSGIVKEVRELEHESLLKILKFLAEETDEISLTNNENVLIQGKKFLVKDLAYRIHPSGLEELVYKRLFKKDTHLFTVKLAR